MKGNTRELVKKFEQEHEIYLGVSDNLTFWIVTARIPKKGEQGSHRHVGMKYISGPAMAGNVLVLPDPDRSDAAYAESWEPMGTIDDFVAQALPRILSDQDAAEQAENAGCGTGCS